MTDASRILLRAVLLGFLALASAVPAHAGGSCAQAIIDDWSDNAVVDGMYPVPCYRQAIAALPEDLLNYTIAADDINRALQERLQNSGGGGTASAGSGTTPNASGNAEENTREPETKKPNGKTDAESAATGEEEPAVPPAGGADPPQGSEGAVASPANDLFDRGLGDGGGSLPLPLIVLIAVVGAAALAVGAWLVRRQLHGRGEGRS